MKLYSFFNSSTSMRVRIALALKGLAHEIVPVNIRSLEHRSTGYVEMNASASVPTLVDGEVVLGQSLAIVDYLDATYPSPRLIPREALLRAQVLELVSLIGCDIHPVNNLRVLRYLQNNLGISDEQKTTWYAQWVAEGFTAAERLLARHSSGPYCFGDAPTLADCWLVPQVFNALRMQCPITAYPRVEAIYRHCMAQPAFQAASPERQPDFMR